jgi:CHAT domain-containing protein
MAEAERAMAKSTEIVKASGVTDAGLMSFIKLSNARFHIINDRPVEAAKAIDECIAYNREKYSQILGFTSEEEMFDASIDYRNAVALRLYIALRNPVEAQNAEGAYLTLVHKNGLILDAMCQYRELERSAKPDAELAANVREYRAMKQRLANATLNPQAGEKPAELKAMEEKAALMQSKIHRRFSDTHLPAYGRMELADIRAKIPAGSALVEFVHLDLYMINRGERALSTIRQYAAFVITADAKEPIRLIDLGKGEAIEDAIKSLGGELQTFAPEEEGRKERQFKRAAAKLHQLLIAPLEPALKGANSLIISPDGAINHVPFAALVNAEGKYLIETHRLRLVTGGRDLLRLPAKEKGAGVAVFADPDYDASFSKPGTSEPFTGGWKKLAHTREEANAIGASLKGGQFGDVRLFLGKDASEEGVKQLHSPRILHLATHGTFVQRSKSFTEADLRSSSTRQMAAANPLLRSAIILAGANKVAPAGQIVDDGILTADEVAFLDLGGTELVVLSACESGLGDLASGEGVQGLRRAFLYAGARSVVATLYPVPDKETAQLMKAFYGELAAGKGKLESLHAAQLKMLQARRGEGNLQPAHPLYWAAFVLIGEDR